jgi:hypothetical protein
MLVGMNKASENMFRTGSTNVLCTSVTRSTVVAISAVAQPSSLPPSFLQKRFSSHYYAIN